MLQITSADYFNKHNGFWRVLFSGTDDELLNDEVILELGKKSAQDNYFNPNGAYEMSPLLENSVRYICFYTRQVGTEIQVKVIGHKQIAETWVEVTVQGSCTQISNFTAYETVREYSIKHGFELAGCCGGCSGISNLSEIRRVNDKTYEKTYIIKLLLPHQRYPLNRTHKQNFLQKIKTIFEI